MSQVTQSNFSLPVLDNTYSLLSKKVKIPTIKKQDGIEKVIDSEENLGIEVIQSDIISFLGDNNAKKIGVATANNQSILVYGIGLAGVQASRFHLCDVGMAQQRVLVSFKRKKLASKYPAAQIEKAMSGLVYEAVSNWADAIIFGKFPLHFGVLSRILLSKEYQEIIQKTRFTYDSLNVLDQVSNDNFWYQMYSCHFALANKLKELQAYAQSDQVMRQLEVTVNQYKAPIMQTYGTEDLVKLFNDMSERFQDTEKVTADFELPSELLPEASPDDVGKETLEPTFNIELISEVKTNPSVIDELKTPKQLDDFLIKLGGKNWNESVHLHQLIENLTDEGAVKVADRRKVLRQFIEQYTETEQVEQ